MSSVAPDSDAGRLLVAFDNLQTNGGALHHVPVAGAAALWAIGEGWSPERFQAAMADLQARGLVAPVGR